MGSADPLKMDEKLKSEKCKKSSFLNGEWVEVIRVMTGWSLVKLIIIIVIIIDHYPSSRVSLFLYILRRAIRAGSCRERRYADHIFIQLYFRMHHFVVKFSKIFFTLGGKGALTP